MQGVTGIAGSACLLWVTITYSLDVDLVVPSWHYSFLAYLSWNLSVLPTSLESQTIYPSDHTIIYRVNVCRHFV